MQRAKWKWSSCKRMLRGEGALRTTEQQLVQQVATAQPQMVFRRKVVGRQPGAAWGRRGGWCCGGRGATKHVINAILTDQVSGMQLRFFQTSDYCCCCCCLFLFPSCFADTSIPSGCRASRQQGYDRSHTATPSSSADGCAARGRGAGCAAGARGELPGRGGGAAQGHDSS